MKIIHKKNMGDPDNNITSESEGQKKQENKERSKRLKAELKKANGTDISAEKLAKKLQIPIGTARGILYKGSVPSLNNCKLYAKKLNIDLAYWITGTRLTLDTHRLADSIMLVEKVMNDRPNEEYTLMQVAYMISMVYNSTTTVCESILNQTADMFSEQNN